MVFTIPIAEPRPGLRDWFVVVGERPRAQKRSAGARIRAADIDARRRAPPRERVPQHGPARADRRAQLRLDEGPGRWVQERRGRAGRVDRTLIDTLSGTRVLGGIQVPQAVPDVSVPDRAEGSAGRGERGGHRQQDFEDRALAAAAGPSRIRSQRSPACPKFEVPAGCLVDGHVAKPAGQDYGREHAPVRR